MGWLLLAALVAIVFAALVRLRVPRLLWSMVGAALMLGAAGYAWQGRPTLPGRAVTADTRDLAPDEAVIDLRTKMFGRYGIEGAYLTAADAMARSGSSRHEVQAILGAIRGSPRSAALWTALGDALVRHDRGQLSAPARFAFDQAIRLAPRDAGPRFFLGLAQVRANDFAAAERSWQQSLSLTSPRASYRDAIVQRLDLLTRLRRAMDGAAGNTPRR
ncbi:tetratricopeptide repeat protein [Sphingomonas rubra]|uniref:Uncharacterized protein n=1 Tax=Sphingomonas rubra TaxID=634430 RepID=A0A1I5SV40_9SPHN|nr:hypothetical protein [Sphingomonas rubra]SFP74558.1 hypothetical protein SAMN04488241_106167 [Sphingomonas rubra]